MKTKEFIERLSALGYSTTKYEDTIEVAEMITPSYGRIHGRIYRKEPYRIETTQHTRQNPRVFDLMVEYARTPLDEREEPKKYVWKLKGTGNNMGTGAYFSKNPTHDKWILGAKNGVLGYLTRFTEMQFHELHTNLGITLEFDKEEI